MNAIPRPRGLLSLSVGLILVALVSMLRSIFSLAGVATMALTPSFGHPELDASMDVAVPVSALVHSVGLLAALALVAGALAVLRRGVDARRWSNVLRIAVGLAIVEALGSLGVRFLFWGGLFTAPDCVGVLLVTTELAFVAALVTRVRRPHPWFAPEAPEPDAF